MLNHIASLTETKPNAFPKASNTMPDMAIAALPRIVTARTEFA